MPREVDAPLVRAASGACAPLAAIGRHRRVSLARLQPRQRFVNAFERGVGDFATVEARFRRRAHGKFAPCPNRPAIHFVARLDQSDAPALLALQDRPIERRRPPVAANAGVNDQTAHAAPDVARYRALEERRDHQVRAIERHGLARHGVVDVEFDRDLMPRVAQRDMQALGERIEAVAERAGRASRFNRSAAVARPKASRRCGRRRTKCAFRRRSWGLRRRGR